MLVSHEERDLNIVRHDNPHSRRQPSTSSKKMRIAFAIFLFASASASVVEINDSEEFKATVVKEELWLVKFYGALTYLVKRRHLCTCEIYPSPFRSLLTFFSFFLYRSSMVWPLQTSRAHPRRGRRGHFSRDRAVRQGRLRRAKVALRECVLRAWRQGLSSGEGHA